MGYRMPLPLDRTEDFNALLRRSSEEQRQDSKEIGASNAEYARARGGIGGDIFNKGLAGFSWGAKTVQDMDANRRAEEQASRQQQMHGGNMALQQAQLAASQQSQQANALTLAEEQARQQYMNQPAGIDKTGPTRQQAVWQNTVDMPAFEKQIKQKQVALQEQGLEIQRQQVAQQGASNVLNKKLLEFNMNKEKIAQGANLYQRANTAAVQSGKPADTAAIDQTLREAGWGPSEISMAKLAGSGSDPMTQLLNNQIADQQTGGLISDFAVKARTYQTALEGLQNDLAIYKANEGLAAEGSQAKDALRRITETLRKPEIGMGLQADHIEKNVLSRGVEGWFGGEQGVQRNTLIQNALATLQNRAEKQLVTMHENIPPQYKNLPGVLQAFTTLQRIQTKVPGFNDAPFTPPARTSPVNYTPVNGQGGQQGISVFRPQR